MSRFFLNFSPFPGFSRSYLNDGNSLSSPGTRQPDKAAAWIKRSPKPPLIRSHILLSHSLQLYHTLAVSPHRKHIHWTHTHCPVAVFLQELHIPGQGRRIAAYIDHPLWSHLKDRFQTNGIAALPWRVHHDHVRMDMVPFILLRQHLLGLADEKLHIFDAVSPGILPGCLLYTSDAADE